MTGIDWKERLQQRIGGGLPHHMGLAVIDVAPGNVTLGLDIQSFHLAPNGYLHAGAVVTLADTACGFGCISNLPDGALNFTTVELKTNFLRTTTAGTLRCVATLQHGGRRTQVWDATVVDETGKALALFRCTQMLLYAQS